MPYRLLKPLQTGGSEQFPLVIFLHGAGERGADNEAQIRHIAGLFLDPEHRSGYPCFVLAPQCPKGQLWAKHNDDGSMTRDPTRVMQLTMALIDEIVGAFPIDQSRIYVTGVSMGGFGTWDLMARQPARFSAAVPVCGGGDEKIAGIVSRIPVWAFHGALDKVVLPRSSRSMIAAMRNAGGDPEYTEYPDVAHNCWIKAYQEPQLLPWLFKQSLRGEGNNN